MLKKASNLIFRYAERQWLVEIAYKIRRKTLLEFEKLKIKWSFDKLGGTADIIIRPNAIIFALGFFVLKNFQPQNVEMWITRVLKFYKGETL